MASPNVTDYAAFNDYAARFGADLASWARLGVEHRADLECEAERARATHLDRADRGRYGRLLAVEVARATASRAAWEAVARETEKRHAEAEAVWAAERRWPALQAEIQRRRPGRSPVSSVRADVTPATSTSTPPTAIDPFERRVAHLEGEGFHFTARAERRALAQADHAARRRRVEEEVARTERLFQTLARNYGRDYAERYMEEGA
jgi:hypothetical protein